MKQFIVNTLLLLLFYLPNCFAQTKDFQTWSSVALQKSFSEKFDGTIQQELRLKENSTQLRLTFTDLELKFNVNKNFSITANYRFIIKPDETNHRIYTNISYSWKKNKFEISPRIRFQHEFIQNSPDENYIRPKISFSYKVNKKWEPFLSEELFFHVLYYKGDEFDESRLSGGVNYDFNKNTSLKLYYLFEQQFNVKTPQQNHVLGIAFEHDL